MDIITINNLKKYYKEVKAVDDITFKVKQGELFAFLGLNGAGKSTTINIICGALKRDSGEVLVDGFDTEVDMVKIKRELGVVFQNSVLDATLSVYDNIKTRATMYGMSKEQFKDNLNFLVEKLELKEILNRQLSKLSGGQKRRVDIARALIHNPKILILDEPTTGLDPKTRMLVWNVINELRHNKSLTVFLTTHYMEEASEADYVVIIDAGKIVATGTPNELKNNYANDFVIVYNYNEKLLKTLEKSGLKYEKKKESLEIVVPSITQAKEFLIKNAEDILDFEIIKGKMDNVFLNVTGKQLKEF